jgi:hypothetical protein
MFQTQIFYLIFYLIELLFWHLVNIIKYVLLKCNRSVYKYSLFCNNLPIPLRQNLEA